jgi:hypothetical protein
MEDEAAVWSPSLPGALKDREKLAGEGEHAAVLVLG